MCDHQQTTPPPAIKVYSEDVETYGFLSKLWYFQTTKAMFICDGRQLFVQDPMLFLFVENLRDIPNVSFHSDNLCFGVFDSTKKVSNSKKYTLFAKGFVRVGDTELSYSGGRFEFHYRRDGPDDTYCPPVVTFGPDVLLSRKRSRDAAVDTTRPL